MRRGDTLGLRALADRFADAVAPDLSNRTRDGRWITILAWSLVRAREASHANGARDTAVSEQKKSSYYTWLRPLELLWVARTIALAGTDWRKRSLSGQRRVQPWYDEAKEAKSRAAPRFGMSVEQFSAYRQTGMYGAYRLVFRKLPGMTILGDGWTPDTETIALAKWLDRRLGTSRPDWKVGADPAEDDAGTNKFKRLGRTQDECHWWLRQWDRFDKGGANADASTLPRQKTDYSVLPEATLLKPLLFGSDSAGVRRTAIANEIVKSNGADEQAVCMHLARVFGSDHTIAVLPQFTQLAEAGMNVMHLMAERLGNKASVGLDDVAAQPPVRRACSQLHDAARVWRDAAKNEFRHINQAHDFADAILDAGSIEASACLRAVLFHHEARGGGLRWFVLRGDLIESRTPPSGDARSRYSFRLWPLCRLATQCGVLRRMPAALVDDSDADTEEFIDG
ncbi:hypothetical protein IMCC9480_3398 [Oxalobacteraceae bacterium IMCC9480]|nr:hypothetical protein IMCC9480_3398 [Oxalobacteraceae bacterium IMCC9480]